MQDVQGIARTLREDLVIHGRLNLADSSPVLTWLVKHAGDVYTLFHKGEPFDGMTPYRRSRGKDWRIALPPFGEVVEYGVRTQNKLHPRWSEGIFLGVSLTSSEKIVGTKEGVFVVQSVRRVLADKRYSQEMIDSITGLPWKVRPTESGPQDEPQEPGHIHLRPEVPEAPAAPTVPEEPKVATRRFYITRADLEEYGYTDGCVACT